MKEYPMNPNPNREPNKTLSMAVFVCGLVSILLYCCGLSIPVSALGIIFYCLNHRQNRPADYYSKLGLWFCIFGIIGSIILIINVFIQLQDPAFVEQMNTTFRQLYGMDMQEMWQYYSNF